MAHSAQKLHLIENAVKGGKLEDVRDVYKANNFKFTDEFGSERENLLHIACRVTSLEIAEFCVKEKGLNVDSFDVLSGTPLIRAAYRGNLEVVQYLLDNGASINLQDDLGRVALIEAAIIGNLPVVECLLNKGAEVNVQNANKKTALMLAASRRHLEIVKYLVAKKADVNVQDKLGMTALMLASGNGHLDIVNHLVENGAKINVQDKDGKTALMLAASRRYPVIVKYLVAKKADLNLQDKDGMTALMLASSDGHLVIVYHLVEKGAKVNVQNKVGMTGLMIAAGDGHLVIVEHLEEKGAKVNVQDKDGMTALMLAARRRYPEIVRYLVRKGAEVNVENKLRMTALMLASGNGDLVIVENLVEGGAKINVQNKYGMTALMLASSDGHLVIVKYLVEKNAKVNVQDKDGMTALMSAAGGPYLKVVQYLLEKGVHVNLRSKDERTALMIAAQYGYLKVVECIVEKEADENVQTEVGKKSLTYWAIEKKQPHVVLYLLEKVDNIYYQDRHKWEPLVKGVQNGQSHSVQQVVKLLMSKGIQGAAVAIYLSRAANKNLKEWTIDINSRYDGQTVLMWAATEGELDIVKYLVEQGGDLQLKDKAEKTPLQLAGDSCQLSVVDFLLEKKKVTSEEFDSLLQSISKFAEDPSKIHSFYIGNQYKSIIRIFTQAKETKISHQVMLLKHIYIALQAKDLCDQEGGTTFDKESRKYERLIGDDVFSLLQNEILRIVNSKENISDEGNRDLWLIAKKMENKYIKIKKGCVQNVETKLTSCWRASTTSCVGCMEHLSEKTCKQMCNCDCELPRLFHKCSARGKFALVTCTLAVLVYLLDLITDFTVGYEDYNGFSKKLGIFEMVLVIFTLMHENIRSSISLYSTEEELLKIKLGKQYIDTNDWKGSELIKSDNPGVQFGIRMFWPFAIRRDAGFLKAVIYNFLTLFQLRPVVDRLRVLMHSPTNFRVLYRHRAEQDSLKQFYLITEQLPELLIQFYTLQIVFNITGNKDMSSNCESGHNFSYPRFTDSLNNPDDKNWFCDEFPMNRLTCDILFRLFSAMIPFFMIPSGIVSLEVDFRLLDPATPKMSATVQYLLQTTYTLMIPARLLMFAALMHAIPMKEIIFGYIIFRVTLELVVNAFVLWKCNRITAEKESEISKPENLDGSEESGKLKKEDITFSLEP